MKQFKFLAAALTLLMGVTFTSCLESDNSPMQHAAAGNLRVGYGAATLDVDGGNLTLNIVNPTDVKLGTGADAFYPERAWIVYTLAEGEAFQEGKKTYDVNFVGHYRFLNEGTFSLEEEESVTSLVQLSNAYWEGNNCINILVDMSWDKNTLIEDFMMYPYDYKSESKTMYLKLVQTTAVDNNSYNTTTEALYFELPSKSALQSKLGNMDFFGTTNDSINVIITANGAYDQELSTKSFKARVRY